MADWEQLFGDEGRQHMARSSPGTPQHEAHAASMLDRENERERELIREGLAGQEGAPPGMGPEPTLTHNPGGQLLEQIQHPAFTTVEHLFRVLPEGAWFDPQVKPQKPIKFEFGSFHVPKNQYFLVTDYQFTPLRQSGVDPFDFVYAADGRFSGVMGFDIRVGTRRTGNISYQLDPAPVQFFRSSFAQPVAPITSFRGGPSSAPFNTAAANAFGSVAGEGKSLLPARGNVQGARSTPFTMIAESDSNVSLSCVIFRRVTSPLAGIEARVAGYQIHANTMSALLERMRPR
jgi:hypothetical protein